jgi:hypothetical protein
VKFFSKKIDDRNQENSPFGEQAISNGFNQYQFQLPKPPLENSEALRTQKLSLAKALWNRNLLFDDNLSYTNSDCPIKINNATLEKELEVIASYYSFFFICDERSKKQGVGCKKLPSFQGIQKINF